VESTATVLPRPKPWRGLVEEGKGVAHRLHAAGDNDLGVTRRYGLRGEPDGFQT
jgi:hypothetical protein